MFVFSVVLDSSLYKPRQHLMTLACFTEYIFIFKNYSESKTNNNPQTDPGSTQPTRACFHISRSSARARAMK